jgi:hypothetical protein
VARLAGLVEDESSHDLSLIYEPESAALTACLDKQGIRVNTNDIFLIVDAGGGTVDFTVHKVEELEGQHVLSEATYRRCLLKGSMFLDGEFESLAMTRLGMGAAEWVDWVKSCPAGALWRSMLAINSGASLPTAAVQRSLILTRITTAACRPHGPHQQNLGGCQKTVHGEDPHREHNTAAAPFTDKEAVS